MEKKCLFFSFILLAFISMAQPAVNEYKEFIIWKENVKLSWNDFKGSPLPNSFEAAMTASSIEFNYATNGTKITWQVTSKYFPKLSWSKKDKQTDYILKHEQSHFNITELYARLFRKELAENVKLTKDIPKMKSISKSIMRQWAEEQHDYDAETNHSMNEEKQNEWNVNIMERLGALNEFASN